MRLPKKETVAVVALGILAAMTSGKAGARIVCGLVNEYYSRGGKFKKRRANPVDEKAFRVVLTRLRHEGLVTNEARGIWGITKQGKEIVIRAVAALRKRETSIALRNPQEKIVIVFDIPEKRRNERMLLRFELLALEFKRLQQSVWIGCGPLPADFIAYLKDHDLLSCVHVFSVNKKGTISFAV